MDGRKRRENSPGPGLRKCQQQSTPRGQTTKNVPGRYTCCVLPVSAVICVTFTTREATANGHLKACPGEEKQCPWWASGEEGSFPATVLSSHNPVVSRPPALRGTDLPWPSSLFAPCRSSLGSMWSSAPEDGLSRSPASRGWAALELLLSSEDEEEL